MQVRPLRTTDVDAVREIFAATLAIGDPLPFDLHDEGAYAALCLDWYLHVGAGDAVVAVDGDDRVVGYALVCLDDAAWRRWARRRATLWTARTVVRLSTGRLRGPARTFHLLRLLDGWRSVFGRAARLDHELPSVHAHLNLLPSARLHGGRALVRAIDERVAASGADTWYGEVNARADRRRGAIAAGGSQVVAESPNATMSWLAGTSVKRLTVVRNLETATTRPLAAVTEHSPSRRSATIPTSP